MALTPIVSNRDVVDGHLYSLRQSEWIDARVLAAGVAESFQAPTRAKHVLISATDNVFCKITPTSNGSAVAATVPAGDVTDGTASELNPAVRILPEDQSYISLIQIIVPPGTLFGIMCTAAGTTHIVHSTLTWEEVPAL